MVSSPFGDFDISELVLQIQHKLEKGSRVCEERQWHNPVWMTYTPSLPPSKRVFGYCSDCYTHLERPLNLGEREQLLSFYDCLNSTYLN